MKQYAVTVVVYINAEDEDSAKMVVDQMIDREYLYSTRGESADIVETSEVTF